MSDANKISFEDFKTALRGWCDGLDEYNNTNNKEFNDILKKYNLTLEDIGFK